MITFLFPAKDKRRGDLTYPQIFYFFPSLSNLLVVKSFPILSLPIKSACSEVISNFSLPKSAIFLLFLSPIFPFPKFCYFFFVSILFLFFADDFAVGGVGEIFGVDNLLFFNYYLLTIIIFFFRSLHYLP